MAIRAAAGGPRGSENQKTRPEKRQERNQRGAILEKPTLYTRNCQNRNYQQVPDDLLAGYFRIKKT